MAFPLSLSHSSLDSTPQTVPMLDDNLQSSLSNGNPGPSTSTVTNAGALTVESSREFCHKKALNVFQAYFAPQESHPERIEELTRIFQAVINTQRKLLFGGSHILEASPSFPKIVVFYDSFQVLEKHLDSGAESNVFKGPFFATKAFSPMGHHQILNAGDWPTSYALKIGKSSNVRYSPQHKKISQAMSPSKFHKFDIALKLARTDRNIGVAVHHLAESDFDSVDYRTFSNLSNVNIPVISLLKMFISALENLEKLHLVHKVHRDIKEKNLLLGSKPDECFITDNSLVRDAFHTPQKRSVSGTAYYYNPSSFNFGKGFLLNMSKSYGMQRECDDMYAMALTLFNCISKLTSQFNNEKFKFMEPEYTIHADVGEFSKEQLKPIQSQYNQLLALKGRVSHAKNSELKGTMDQVALIFRRRQKKPDQIVVFPPIEQRKDRLLFEISRAQLRLEEKKMLKKMVELAIGMIKSFDKDRLTVSGMRIELQKIVGKAQSVNSAMQSTTGETSKRPSTSQVESRKPTKRSLFM